MSSLQAPGQFGSDPGGLDSTPPRDGWAEQVKANVYLSDILIL